MFRCLKVWVKIGLGICNFAEWIHVHEIYCLPSKKFKEYQESGFLELAFLDRFTGNIDIYIHIYIAILKPRGLRQSGSSWHLGRGYKSWNFCQVFIKIFATEWEKVSPKWWSMETSIINRTVQVWQILQIPPSPRPLAHWRLRPLVVVYNFWISNILK